MKHISHAEVYRENSSSIQGDLATAFVRLPATGQSTALDGQLIRAITFIVYCAFNFYGLVPSASPFIKALALYMHKK